MKISVAMCTCNGQPWLGPQLQSLIDQQRMPDELVVCDDLSTDKTVEVIEQFRQRSPFPVRLYQNDQHLGHAQNFAQCIAKCDGDVILPCDQDDVWCRPKISRLARVFQARPQVKLAACDSQMVDGNLKPLGYTNSQSHRFNQTYQTAIARGKAFDVFLRLRTIPGHAMALRADSRDVILPIPDGWMHDQWIAIVAAALGPVVWLPDPLVRYRQHQRQSIGGSRRRLRKWWKTDPTLPSEHFLKQVQQFEALQTRLRAFEDRLPNAQSFLRRVQEKIDFLRTRAAMRRSVWVRGPLILSQLLHGRYHRLAQGWLTVARDLAG